MCFEEIGGFVICQKACVTPQFQGFLRYTLHFGPHPHEIMNDMSHPQHILMITRFSPRKRPPGVLNSSERDDPTELSEVSFLSRDRRGEVKLSVPGKSDQITGWFQTWLMMVNDG